MKLSKAFFTGVAAAVAASMTISVSAAGLGYSTQDVEFYVDNVNEVKLSTKVDFPDTVMSEYGGLTIDALIPAGSLEKGAYTFKAESFVDDDLRERTSEFLSQLYDVEGVYSTELKEIYTFDLSFTDEDGNLVSPDGVEITLNMYYAGGCSYNVFVVEADGSLTRLDHEYVMTGMKFVPPHFSQYVVAGYIEHYVGRSPTPIPDYDASEPEYDPTTPDPTSPPPTTSRPNTSPKPVDRTSHIPHESSENSIENEESQGSMNEPPLPSESENTTPESQVLPKPDDKGANTGDSGFAVSVIAGVIALAALSTALVASKSKKASK